MTFFLNFILIPWTCALIASAAAAPLGCIISWRRLIYFGEALAHASWLGIALALYLGLPVYLGIWCITSVLIILLMLLKKRSQTDANNLLGTLSHLLLALGVAALSKMENIRTDLFGYLFGDILNTTGADLILILIAAAAALTMMKFIWQPLILLTISEPLARAENPRSGLYDTIFLITLGLFTGIMMQMLGLMLIMAFLIIPVQTAGRIAKNPEQTAAFAAASAAIAATGGFILAYTADLPAAPAIVINSGILYFAAQVYHWIKTQKSL